MTPLLVSLHVAPDAEVFAASLEFALERLLTCVGIGVDLQRAWS